MMLDLLRNEVMSETLDARIAMLIDPVEAAQRVSKRLLNSTSFMASIATFSG